MTLRTTSSTTPRLPPMICLSKKVQKQCFLGIILTTDYHHSIPLPIIIITMIIHMWPYQDYPHHSPPDKFS